MKPFCDGRLTVLQYQVSFECSKNLSLRQKCSGTVQRMTCIETVPAFNYFSDSKAADGAFMKKFEFGQISQSR